MKKLTNVKNYNGTNRNIIARLEIVDKAISNIILFGGILIMRKDDFYPKSVSDQEVEFIKTAPIYAGTKELQGTKLIRPELINIVIRTSEIFKAFDANPRYVIGNHGTLYDRKTQHILTPSLKNKNDQNSYRRSNLSGVGSTYIHQMVGAAFVPGYGTPGLVLSHKNGARGINSVENLQMVPRSEAKRYKRAMIKSDCAPEVNQSMAEEKARRVCELIIAGLDNKQIASTMMQEFGLDSFPVSYVKRMRDGYKDLSIRDKIIRSEYVAGFPIVENVKNTRLYTDTQVEEMCRLLSLHITDKYVAIGAGVEYDDTFRRFLYRLKKRMTCTDISDKYPRLE